MPPTPSALRVTLVGLAALALAMGVGRFAYTPLLPMMLEDGLIGIDRGGVLASVHFLGYWLGALFAARVPLAPRALLRLSLLTIAVATLGMGLTENFGLWLAYRWLCGVSSAWVLVLVSNYVVKVLAERGRQDCQGWVFSGVGAGIAVVGLACLAFMVGGTLSASAWRALGAVSLVAAAVVSLALGAETPDERPALRQRAAAKGPLDWRAVIAYGMAGLGYIIPATYLPVMAKDIVASPLVFGWSWPVFGAAAFVSTLFSARLHARFSDRRVWAASQGVMAFGLLLPAFHQHMATIIVAGLCVGGTFMIITMAGMKEAHRTAAPDDVMRHIAAMTTAFATGQMIGPVFASMLFEISGGFGAALAITSAAVLVTALTLKAGPARYGARDGRKGAGAA